MQIQTPTSNYYLVVDYADKRMNNHYLVDISNEEIQDVEEDDYVVVSSRHGEYRLAKVVGYVPKAKVIFVTIRGYDGDTKECEEGRYNGNYYVQKVVDKRRELAVKTTEVVAKLSALAEEKKELELKLARRMDVIMAVKPEEYPEDVRVASARLAEVKKEIACYSAKLKELQA